MINVLARLLWPNKAHSHLHHLPSLPTACMHSWMEWNGIDHLYVRHGTTADRFNRSSVQLSHGL